MDSYPNIFTPSLNTIGFCLFNGGDLAAKYNIKSKLADINDIDVRMKELDKVSEINISASGTSLTTIVN